MSDNLELISKFNNKNLKPILNVKDMVLHHEYVIDGCYRTTTKYGDAVVLSLEGHTLYLPKRFNSLDDITIRCINEGSFSISKQPLLDDEDKSLSRLELKQQITASAFYSPYLNV